MAVFSRREFLMRCAGTIGAVAALSGCKKKADLGEAAEPDAAANDAPEPPAAEAEIVEPEASPADASDPHAVTGDAEPQPWDLCWSRLPLEGTVNTREMGGYPTLSGGHTNYHTFLRSDELTSITDYDAEFLRNYGVSLVIDLRSEWYFENEPDRPIDADVPVVNVPLYELLTEEDINLYYELNETGQFYIERYYDFVLANKERLRECFEAMAAAEGCVLYHCRIGKDRTGCLSILLLQLAGCDDEDIVSNYMVSRVNLTRDPSYKGNWESNLTEQVRSRNESAPSSGEYVLQFLAEHGGARQYLLECGVSEESLDKICARFVG